MPGPNSEEAETASETAALRAELDALRRAHTSQQLLLRAIADHAPIVLYAKDLAGRFTLSNRLHAALLGRKVHEVVGATEAELLDEATAAEIQAVADTVARSRVPHVAEFAIPLDGVTRVFLEHVFPLGDDERVAGIGGAAIDITERKQAEDAARVFAALAEHSPDGVLVRPGDPLQPLRANPALLRLLGLPADAPAERAAEWFTPGVAGARQLLRIDGGTIDVEVTAFDIPGDAGERPAAALIVRDVTSLQQALREREQQVEHNRRQQAELIAELSAPLLPLLPGVLLLPLIGSLDDARAEHVREVVLDGIAQHQSRVLILDLTGLRAVDGTPADRLRGLIEAVQLIGARVVLTGIRPAVAAALVDVGFAPRRGVTVLATLADALQATLASAGRSPRSAR
jgi:rsbT co-antagonist protein RsbR